MTTLGYIKIIRNMLGDNGFIPLENGTYRDSFLGHRVLVETNCDPSGKDPVVLKAAYDGNLDKIIASHDISLNSVPESVIEFLRKYHEQTRTLPTDPLLQYA